MSGRYDMSTRQRSKQIRPATSAASTRSPAGTPSASAPRSSSSPPATASSRSTGPSPTTTSPSARTPPSTSAPAASSSSRFQAAGLGLLEPGTTVVSFLPKRYEALLVGAVPATVTPLAGSRGIGEQRGRIAALELELAR